MPLGPRNPFQSNRLAHPPCPVKHQGQRQAWLHPASPLVLLRPRCTRSLLLPGSPTLLLRNPQPLLPQATAQTAPPRLALPTTPTPRVLQSTPQFLCYAFGAGALRYHGPVNRGSTRLTLLPSAVPPPPTAAPGGPAYSSVPLRMADSDLPTESSIYLCRHFPLPNPETKVHLTHWEMLIDNPARVHHIVLYGCKLPPSPPSERYECANMDLPCLTPLFVWNRGSPLADSAPPEAGYAMGGATGITWLAMQVHYLNPSGAAGGRDATGINLHLTPNTRQHDMGVLVLGNVDIAIPPGQPSFDLGPNVCPGACTQRLPGPVTVVASSLHGHTILRGGKTQWVRGGAEVAPLMQRRAYSMDFQAPAALEPSRPMLLPGDTLLTTCTYDSSRRSSTTGFGPTMQDEMCFNFVFYYPAVPGLEICSSYSVPYLSPTPLALCSAYSSAVEVMSLYASGNAAGAAAKLFALRVAGGLIDVAPAAYTPYNATCPATSITDAVSAPLPSPAARPEPSPAAWTPTYPTTRPPTYPVTGPQPSPAARPPTYPVTGPPTYPPTRPEPAPAARAPPSPAARPPPATPPPCDISKPSAVNCIPSCKLPCDTEECLYACHKDTLLKIVQDASTPAEGPNMAAFGSAVANLMLVLAPDVLFRIEPLGVFPGVTAAQYFATFVHPLGLGESVVNPRLTYFANSGQVASGRVVLETFNRADPTRRMTSLSLSIWVSFDAQTNRVTYADGVFDKLAEFFLVKNGFEAVTSPEAADPRLRLSDQRAAFIVAGVCQVDELFCRPLGVSTYNNTADCMAFVSSLPRIAPFGGQGNNLFCRGLHAPYATVDPRLHCPHLGRDGGGACVDVPYASYFGLFPEGAFLGQPAT